MWYLLRWKLTNLKFMQSQLLYIQTLRNRILFKTELRQDLSLSAIFPALDRKIAIKKWARIEADFTQLKLIYNLTIFFRLLCEYPHTCAKLTLIYFFCDILFFNSDGTEHWSVDLSLNNHHVICTITQKSWLKKDSIWAIWSCQSSNLTYSTWRYTIINLNIKQAT